MVLIMCLSCMAPMLSVVYPLVICDSILCDESMSIEIASVLNCDRKYLICAAVLLLMLFLPRFFDCLLYDFVYVRIYMYYLDSLDD